MFVESFTSSIVNPLAVGIWVLNSKFEISNLKSKISNIKSLRLNLGGYSAEVPPLPIPNRVVKLSIADGTALHRGRVGSRHFQKPLGFVLGASLFVGVIIPFLAAVGISFRAMPCIKCPSSLSLAPFHSAKISGEKKSSLSSFFVSLSACMPSFLCLLRGMPFRFPFLSAL